jgi:hypothetical protein
MKQLSNKAIFLIPVFLITQLVYGQEARQKLYFLADTVEVSKNNQILEIGSEGAYKYYSFFCKCIPGYSEKVVFNYLLKKESLAAVKKPDITFVSWKALSDLITKFGVKFDEHYSLTIVEVLPNKQYLINPVKSYIRKPIVDYIKL